MSITARLGASLRPPLGWTGEAVAVLIGRRQYERLTGRYRSFSDAYEVFTRDVDLVELGIDPDELFAGTRDETRGRDVRL